MAMTANFIMVLLPFYASKISPYSSQETLLWVGLIMGSQSFVVMIASNFWGVLTSRFSPKLLFMRGLFANFILFLLMGFTTSLHVLLILRVIQGIFGGISTVGLIIISSSSSPERIPADIGFFQAFLTFGQLVGPPIGTLAASVFGYRGAFVSVSIFLLVIILFSYLNVKEVPLQSKQEKLFGRSTLNRETIVAWLLCFAVTVQLMFLPSVLPNVFEAFHMERAVALKWAGVVIMLYTGTTTLGTYFWSRLSLKLGRDRMILLLVVLGTLFQALLSLSQGMIDFIVIRMIQTGLIAAAVPLVISIFATELKGGTIGFVNSARFAGNAFGPMIATSVLAISNLPTLYLFISGLTLFALFAFKFLSKSAFHSQ
jgi:MFS family permease